MNDAQRGNDGPRERHWRLFGHLVLGRKDVVWIFSEPLPSEENRVDIYLQLGSSKRRLHRRDAQRKLREELSERVVSWLTPRDGVWRVNLDALREAFPPKLSGPWNEALDEQISWLQGTRLLEPEIEEEQEDLSDGTTRYRTSAVFYIEEKQINEDADRENDAPLEVEESLYRFRQDYPEPRRVGFLMMSFVASIPRERIVKAIREFSSRRDIAILRSDEKQYHEDLYYNVLTYIYGSGFGIALFERLEEESFNPNVALEVGFMLALRKPVCLLKDRTLRVLHADIVGKLYRTFDPHDPEGTIAPALERWMRDMSLL